jgi:rare lipoprotein A
MALMSRIKGEGAGAPGHMRAVVRSSFRIRSAKAPLMALGAAAAVAALGGCASSGGVVSSSLAPGGSEPMFPESKWGVSASRRVAGENERIPKGGGVYKVGEPYQVGGRWYNPREQPEYDRVGIASWYGSDFHGRHTANGEVFDMHALTAAHPTLPIPSYAYVTNLSNNRTILVRINDRGPYVGERMIDLSKGSADALGLRGRGTGRVRVRYAGPAPLSGDDGRERQFLASRSWRSGADIAALERAQSVQEYGAFQQREAPMQQSSAWVPPVEQRRMSVAERQPMQSYAPQDLNQGRDQSYRQSYAEAEATSGELWSPAQYRAAIAAR